MRLGRNSGLIFYTSYFVLAGFLLLLDFRGKLDSLHSFAQRVTTPIKESLFKAKTETLGRFGLLGRLGKEERNTEELQGRIFFLEGRVLEMGVLREENARMRYLLGAGLPANWQFAAFRVVSVYADSLYGHTDFVDPKDKILINTDQGTKGGIYVGRVEKVLGRQAEVFLPTKDGERIPVRVRDKDSGEAMASGILFGRGGRVFIDQVLTGETLREGDLVLTSGDEVRPSELLIGMVFRILPISAGAFQQAEVVQALDYRKLQVIFLITRF